MDVREKLVELINEFYGCDPMYYGVDVLAMAQHLIANGVTVQVCKLEDKKTNADRIRSMSDEELNELFNEIYNAGEEDAVAYEWGQRTNSFEWTMEWLRQPVQGGE